MKSYLVSAYKKINYLTVVEAKSYKDAEKIFKESIDEVRDIDTIDDYKIKNISKIVRCE
jgi:hypothetical protein